MNFQLPQFFAAAPEIFLLTMACVVLVADAFVASRKYLTYYLVQFSLIAVFALTVMQYQHLSSPIITFSGSYVVDKLAILAKLFIYAFSFFAFIYARDYINHRKIARSEYYLLGLFAVIGMSVLVSGHSFLTIYLGLELLSLMLYAMVAMHKDSNIATEAAMKYFVLGGLASGMLLYGLSLLYGLTGTIQLDLVANSLASHQDVVQLLAMVFVLAGVAFKFGAVPFHLWVPDVYQGAPTPVTLFIASAPKIAAFVLSIRLLVQAMPSLHMNWDHVLIIITILSMFLGNALAIAQTNLKRMLAYSSIAHIGYTLLGVLAGPYVSQGYSAALFYIVTYAIVATGAFAIIAILSRDGVEFDNLEDYQGLNARSPWLAFLMLLLLFSMAGVPPTVGFFAKLGLIEALISAHMVWLAVLALLFALIGAYYYLRVVMLMYFKEPTLEMQNTPITMTGDTWVAISVNGLAALILGLLPSALINLCHITVVS